MILLLSPLSPVNPAAPGFCSLWVYQKDPSVFALCAGPPNDARVLVMTADSAEDAEQWVRAIAGRLYLNELRLDDDMIPGARGRGVWRGA